MKVNQLVKVYQRNKVTTGKVVEAFGNTVVVEYEVTAWNGEKYMHQNSFHVKCGTPVVYSPNYRIEAL